MLGRLFDDDNDDDDDDPNDDIDNDDDDDDHDHDHESIKMMHMLLLEQSGFKTSSCGSKIELYCHSD